MHGLTHQPDTPLLSPTRGPGHQWPARCLRKPFVGGRARGKRLAVIVSSVSVQLEGHRGQSLCCRALLCTGR